MSMKDLLISTSFMVQWCVAAQYARRIVNKTLKDKGLILVLMNEAIASAELCACCFELAIVSDNFGVPYYAVYLFLLNVWWSIVWGDASACPYMHVEDLLEGKTTLPDVALCTWAELMSGFCVYRIVQVFWWFEFAETHAGHAFEGCNADLTVNPFMGAAIEGIATFLCRLTSRTLSAKDLKFGGVIDSFIGMCLVVPALDYTGGYFNPVLATALTFRCNGNTNLEHIIVYWIGTCTGATLSVYFFKVTAIRKFLLGPELTKNRIRGKKNKTK
ncbi:hypothetical protein DOY81_001270 [Sarcophaga bullata]|nr:hypothetical protein DOY81_001270 [Sarcophaga bullata]